MFSILRCGLVHKDGFMEPLILKDRRAVYGHHKSRISAVRTYACDGGGGNDVYIHLIRAGRQYGYIVWSLLRLKSRQRHLNRFRRGQKKTL